MGKTFVISVFASEEAASEVRAAVERFSREHGGSVKDVRWSEDNRSATICVHAGAIESVMPVLDTIRCIVGVNKADITTANF